MEANQRDIEFHLGHAELSLYCQDGRVLARGYDLESEEIANALSAEPERAKLVLFLKVLGRLVSESGGDRSALEVALSSVNKKGSPLQLTLEAILSNNLVYPEIAINPSTPHEVLTYSYAQDEWGHKYIAMNTNCPLGLIRKMVKSTDYEVRCNLAGRRENMDILLVLASDEDYRVREILARNKNISDEIKRVLAFDKEYIVRKTLIQENILGQYLVMQMLAVEQEQEILSVILYNQVMSMEALRIVNERGDGEIRAMIVSRINCDREFIEELSRDHEEIVRIEVAASSLIGSEILERMAQDESWEVRLEVARNPNTPVLSLEALADDENISVRKMVEIIKKKKISIELEV